MTKTNFTAKPWLTWVLAVPMLFFGIQRAGAQALACNNLVQVSIDPTPNQCHALINADMILEGDPLPGHDYQITIKHGITVIATGVNEVEINNASQYFGQTLTTTIEDLATGNSCWGNMTLEDKLPPVITCGTATIGCWEDLNTVALPTAVDNCDATPTIQLTNETINTSGLCGNGQVIITRTYIAFDDYNNISASCDHVITVERPAAVDFPNDIIWTCDQYAAYPTIVDATALHAYVGDSDPGTSNIIDVNLDPDCDDNDAPYSDNADVNSTNTANGGNGCPGNGLDDADVLELTGSGVVANIIGQYCNYQQSSSDQILQTCGNTFKIIRTWTVLDWCTGAVVTTGVGGEDNVQIIKVMDKEAPLISVAPFTVPVTIPGQHPQVCTSTGFLVAPSYSDNCNDVTVKIFTPVGEAIYTNGSNGNNGGMIPAPGLPVGVHDVTYQATDACGNQTNITVQVTVVDNAAPTTVCDEITDVNLATDGKAVVIAEVFDDGTHDNCCLDHFEVRRMEDNCDDGHDDTVFGPSVVFCCNDLDQSPITVVFRAFDCYGNYNDCMVTVNVNDKIAPSLVSCPANENVTCDFYAENLETQLADLEGDPEAQSEFLDQYFGNASFYDNCDFTVTRGININIDQCLEGAITRTWSAQDGSGNNGTQTCSQTIFVDHVSDWVVEFPADITVNCGNTVPNFGEPEIFYETCELVAVSYDDVIYNVVPDACYKIQRTWTVINWCVVGGNIDEEVVEAPENALGLPFPACDLDGDGDCDGRTFRDSWNAASKPTVANATQITDPDTDPDSDPWDGYITYEQIIKVIDDVDPVFAGGCAIDDVEILSNGCTATVLLPTPDVQDCSPNVTITVTSDLGAGFGPFAEVAPGTYDVTYNAIDNCNNQTNCHTTLTVFDGKKPTPYCKNGVVVELMNTNPAMVEIWASDLDAGSFDNCPGDLELSFSSDVNDKSRVYTCDDLGQQPVQLWVTDANDNQDYCETFVIIQANMGQCGGPLVASLGGAVANEDNSPVEDVTMNLSGQSAGVVQTDVNGMYNFANIPIGNDVTVTPEKDNDPLNGVTTYDLVLISKHILGTQALGSPYKLIAADANKTKSVTTADLVELRKLILQIIPNLSNNTSWRFVDKGYVFPDPSNPWSEEFPEVININNIPTSVLDADFVAVKVGDVNGNATTNLTAGVEERTNGNWTLVADDKKVEKGEEVTVSFTAADANVLGFQFTLNFDREVLEFVDIVPGVATAENFGLTLLDKGAITTSWNGQASADKLFTVVFRAKAATRVSDALGVNSRFTPAEAYDVDGSLMGVQLSFNGAVASNFELYQNVPNPFKGETTIGFNLPEAGIAKLTVTDMAGRVLTTIEREFAAGYNQLSLNSNDLNASGVMYYTLETATNTATRKLIAID